MNNTFRKALPGIFLLFIIGIGVGYAIEKYILSDDVRTPNDIVINDGSDQGDRTGDQDTQAPSTETPANSQEGDAQAPATELTFCEDLKSGIPGSEGFNIAVDVAGSETLTSESVMSGCVYSVNGSYSGWAPFEAQIGSYRLLASDGSVLDEGPLPVVNTEAWMLDALAGLSIQFEQEFLFDADGYTSGTLELKNENASGEPGLDRVVTIPVTF